MTKLCFVPRGAATSDRFAVPGKTAVVTGGSRRIAAVGASLAR
ncbi:MAG: hypothetical protein M0Z82_09735 [Actinomycetota bacterium]|nr:hypothetical protein [Actinomycetota bacterium]